MRQVDRSVVQIMRDQLRGQTDETLMPQFGISYNTWRKIRDGLPVRSSLAERIEMRVNDNTPAG